MSHSNALDDAKCKENYQIDNIILFLIFPKPQPTSHSIFTYKIGSLKKSPRKSLPMQSVCFLHPQFGPTFMKYRVFSQPDVFVVASGAGHQINNFL